MSNTDLVLKMYSYFNSGELQKIREELFHPEIEWRMPGHHPLSGAHSGVDQVMAFFEALFKAGIWVDGTHFGELDDGVVVERHMGHAKVGETEVLFPTVTTYGFRDGRIAQVQVHTADQHGVDTYMWGQFTLRPIGERMA
ncbi:nuclear transport factor 2 family protein [Nonomuraea sp. LPB2021202275-12-8]|uniref:nuclear transport factor 2 family protein n=1 Tax=Nonomuraea sp. LPB2021202275-12-8 TaxID=3120159 RepID=UPI00300D32DB